MRPLSRREPSPSNAEPALWGPEQRVRKKVVTTTFSYDADGNVVQKTVDGTTTTYVYDYSNRLTTLGVGGATTTYAYDWGGNRVSQTGTSTTFIYPCSLLVEI
jgi:YD repeat-containing protein